MEIFIDGDACPVVKQAEIIAKKYNLKVTLLCDTNHILTSNYSEIFIVGAGMDAVDFVLVNKCKKGDIVITQDYGVAGINQNGRLYTNENIDRLLMERHIAKSLRKASSKNHLKGPKKRTHEDDLKFCESFEKLILKVINLEKDI